MMMKFRITQEKEREKEEDYYTDNGGFPLSLKFDIQDNEWTVLVFEVYFFGSF